MDDQQHSYGRHHRGEALLPGCTWARETFPFQPGDGMTLIGALSEGGRFAPGWRWIRTIGTPQRNNFSRPSPFDPPQFAFRKRNWLLRTRNRWFESTSLQR
jgi:hypothetical protein